MPVERRPPMPKLPPFALADAPLPSNRRSYYLAALFLLSGGLLIFVHLQLLGLPFFWDEQGQFIPTALDLLRTGSWVAHSTLPNVHPPGVEAYLAVWYRLWGFSIPVTRVAMLVIAGGGLLTTFLLAIELSRAAGGAPAFLPPFFLLVSPLFYMQSMLAQLDMPAMVFTCLALLLFVKKRYIAASLVCLLLVLVKETGLVVPAVFAGVFVLRKDPKRALLFVPPVLALSIWLIVLRSQTGYWLGNPGFAHYNVDYALHPARVLFSLVRRVYYLFFGEFRWIGTAVLLYTWRRCPAFKTEAWKVTLAVSIGTLLLVSVLGGAELERYLLPVLPVFYIAVSIGLTVLPRFASITAIAGLIAGLLLSLFWNPPYPFPYENNYALVDFVRLQQAAGQFAEHTLQGRIIATAWPYSSALRSPDYGFVDRPLDVLETSDFHASTIEALPRESYDALITYTRTWTPESGVIRWTAVRQLLSRYYDWEPDITPEQCASLGLRPLVTWRSRGQQITVYVRPRTSVTAGGAAGTRL